MQRIDDYELCDLGVEHPDYFQGFGTSFTSFTDSVVGIGDTPREALADALEQVAQCGFDADDLARRIAADEEWAIDEHGVVLAPDEPSLADEPDSDCYDRYYHVGIRWASHSAADHWRQLARDPFASAYADCALWSSLDNSDESGGRPLDDTYDLCDLSDKCAAEMLRECADFQEANRDLLDASGLSVGQQGHDFWLTRNGHGAGFWDRGLGKVGEELTRAAKVYGSVDLYVGADGRIYS